MITKNSVVKFQNLVESHESRPVKSPVRILDTVSNINVDILT